MLFLLFTSNRVNAALFKNPLWKTYNSLVTLEAMVTCFSSGKYGIADRE